MHQREASVQQLDFCYDFSDQADHNSQIRFCNPELVFNQVDYNQRSLAKVTNDQLPVYIDKEIIVNKQENKHD